MLRTGFNGLPIVLVCLVLGGCATSANFRNTPSKDSDFTKSMVELERDYADIKKYDRTFAGPAAAPRADELVKLWGEPAARKKDWAGYALSFGVGVGFAATGYMTYPLLAVFYLLQPGPREEYAWRKGNYEIVARGRNDALVGYEKRIFRWKWKEDPNTGASVALNAQPTAAK